MNTNITFNKVFEQQNLLYKHLLTTTHISLDIFMQYLICNSFTQTQQKYQMSAFGLMLLHINYLLWSWNHKYLTDHSNNLVAFFVEGF